MWQINVDSVVQKQNSTENVYIYKGIKVTSGDLSNPFSSFIKSEKNLFTICNIKSCKILDALTELMNRIYPKTKQRLLCTRDRDYSNNCKAQIRHIF